MNTWLRTSREIFDKLLPTLVSEEVLLMQQRVMTLGTAILVAVVLMAPPAGVSAATPDWLAQTGPSHFVPQQQRKRGQDNREAISNVKRKFPGSKVLSVDPAERQGRSVHRVKTLSEDGVVKYIYVDDATGDVIE